MKKLVLIGSVALVMAGCAGRPTIGHKVFVTPAHSSHLTNCEMLGQVEVDAAIFGLWDRNEQVKEIKYRLRDAAASKFPQADTVTHTDLNVNSWTGPDSNIMGVAFKCFDK